MYNVLQFIKQFFTICIVLHVICYLLCIYIYHICVAYVSVGPNQRGLLCAESGFGMRGFQGHMSHAVPSLSLSLSLYSSISPPPPPSYHGGELGEGRGQPPLTPHK